MPSTISRDRLPGAVLQLIKCLAEKQVEAMQIAFFSFVFVQLVSLVTPGRPEPRGPYVPGAIDEHPVDLDAGPKHHGRWRPPGAVCESAQFPDRAEHGQKIPFHLVLEGFRVRLSDVLIWRPLVALALVLGHVGMDLHCLEPGVRLAANPPVAVFLVHLDHQVRVAVQHRLGRRARHQHREAVRRFHSCMLPTRRWGRRCCTRLR